MRTVVVTSARDRVFCSGANIFMLGVSSHAWKVNFCKFTNETRNGLEDSSTFSGLKFLAAVNGSCAGGGYELALSCDEIVLIDDRSSAVSLPEVPLLGVLPGTGGLTRLTDKRHVRHDLADVFCTTSEGVRGQKAVDWRLVDHIAKPAQFEAKVRERALALAATSDRPQAAKGVELTPLERDHRTRRFALRPCFRGDRPGGAHRDLHRQGPVGPRSRRTSRRIEAAGANWYPLALARELEDAILSMRTNELDIGVWLIKTAGRSGRGHGRGRDAPGAESAIGSCARRSAICAALSAGSTSPRAACSRSSRKARASPARCSNWRSPATASTIWRLPDDPARAPKIVVGAANFGDYPMASGQSRLGRRFYDETPALEAVKAKIGEPLDAAAAFALGLATSSPDDIDWSDEVRLAIEERVSMSPDALTALEANLRFDGPETLFTRVFGRLSAWQNWIFQRPNAVGDKGALKVYGKGEKAAFDWNRV